MPSPDAVSRTTRSLGITPGATSDNLTPQETTTQDTGTVGAEGADLSCSGGSVVADRNNESGRVEAATVTETLGPDLVQSFSTQSLQDDQEIGMEPMKPD
ncbi:hypothetical protein YTPLAS72_02240 [Nitrospira sp.]|nr:hypothetical protein YTPLAS72_02240 [Nitrospira sp.]